MGPVEGLGGQVPILIKPFLFVIAFGQAAVLFASVIGLAGWVLTMLARAISVANFRWLQVSATVRDQPQDRQGDWHRNANRNELRVGFLQRISGARRRTRHRGLARPYRLSCADGPVAWGESPRPIGPAFPATMVSQATRNWPGGARILTHLFPNPSM